mmetsp:Transcript_1797/g.6419  ORF Transcript_1797/g.6419 Transcript_1797/m.6419 type:complete len:266 (+) Transcript_1797:105-902(+)
MVLWWPVALRLALLLVGCPPPPRAAAQMVVATWFPEAVDWGYEALLGGGAALDAVEQGCALCEVLQCDGTVGYGGSPDERGETTLDALIMDGESMEVGAVGGLRRVKGAIAAARLVMERSQHTMLVGDHATEFAVEMGMEEDSLSTQHSKELHDVWVAKGCQPNFRRGVTPDPSSSCGPYTPAFGGQSPSEAGGTGEAKGPQPRPPVSEMNHDTIAMVAIDAAGRISAGTSTNGALHKVPGRVGDSPIPRSRGCGASILTSSGPW